MLSSCVWWKLWRLKCQDSPVSIQTRLWIGWSDFNSQQGQWWYVTWLQPGAHPASYSMATRSSQSMRLTTPLHLVLRLRMYGPIPLLPQYIFTAWCITKRTLVGGTLIMCVTLWHHLWWCDAIISTAPTMKLKKMFLLYVSTRNSPKLLQLKGMEWWRKKGKSWPICNVLYQHSLTGLRKMNC
jgi:hypothetical protein